MTTCFSIARLLVLCITIWLVLCCNGCAKRVSPDDAAVRPTPDALLAELRERYLGLNTYQDEVRLVQIDQMKDESPHEGVYTQISFVWERPNRLAFVAVDEDGDPYIGLFCDGSELIEVNWSLKEYTVYDAADSLDGLLDMLEDGRLGAKHEASSHPMLALLTPLRENPNNMYYQLWTLANIDRHFVDDHGRWHFIGTLADSEEMDRFEADELELANDQCDVVASFTIIVDSDHGLIEEYEVDLTAAVNLYAQIYNEDDVVLQYRIVWTVERRIVNERIEERRFSFEPPADFRRVER